MADTKKKSKKTASEQAPVELQETKHTVKISKKIFTIPKHMEADKSGVAGEFPLRTYEMFRDQFVGIN